MTYSCGNGYCGSAVQEIAPYRAPQGSEPVYLCPEGAASPILGSTASYLSRTYDTHVNLPHSSTITEPFLRPDRPCSKFIADAAEIAGYVTETFNKVTGRAFPENVFVHVLGKEKLQEAHPLWHEGLVGFARNRLPGASDVFAQQSTLDRLLLIIGHELGHVSSRPHQDRMLEEAKAFAFELAWLDAMREHNIAGLSGALTVDPPAHNGLHDAALDFVLKSKRSGIQPFDLFTQLCHEHYFV